MNDTTRAGSLQDRQVIEGKDHAHVPPSIPANRIRGHIDEPFAQAKQLPEILEATARLGAQLPMQAALEAEVTEFLGRARSAAGRPGP